MKTFIAATALLVISTSISMAEGFKPDNGWYRLQTMFLEKENRCLEGNKIDPESTLGGATFQDTCQNVSGQ